MALMCLSCNNELTDFEKTRRYLGTYHYVDLCNRCFSTVVPKPEVAERYDVYDGADGGVPDESEV